MSQSIDTGVERTPPAVAAMKSFKEKLLQGHKVKASQFGIELPTMTTQENVAYDVEDTEQDVGFDNELTAGESNVGEDDELDFSAAMMPSPAKIINKDISSKDPIQMLASYLEQTPAKEDLKIVGPFGKLGFKALNVSITDFGVAFIIKKDAIQFEPNINTELTIQYRGQDYSVIYAGGFFTFPKIPFTFVSFLRVQPE
jgi:hypothetical protein